jgi:hypothetical protein
MKNIIRHVFRFLFAWIDSLVARLITMIYKLFTDMTDLVIYGDNIVKTIGRRIGLILGIFMLFKLAVSLINYMISPDKLSDKSQGGGKLIVNVIISLSLLISVNFIFKEAYMIQGKVIESHIIEKIFFGESGVVKSTNENEAGSVKMDIGYYLYTGFFSPNNEVFRNACDDLWDVSADITVAKDSNRACSEYIANYLTDDERANIFRARNTLDMSYVLSDWDTVNAEYGEKYVFDYMPIISTAAGIICLIIMISFSMSLATRAIKLFFLQIVAPIPIISNMDLGKGQDIFKKWVKQCVNTYLTVFIRVAALDFAVFMMVLLRGNYKNVFTNNVWLNIFLIVGCLFFAKEVPKLLEDLFGIKLDGMTLHPLKNFQENALFGKQIGGVAKGATLGVAGAGLAGVAAFGTNVFATEGNLFRRLGSGFAGATSASMRAVGSGLKGKKLGDIYKSSYNTAMKNRMSRADRLDDDVKWREMMASKIDHAINKTTMGETVKATNDNLSKLQGIYKSMMSALEGADDVANSIVGEGMFAGRTFDGIKGLTKFEDEVKKTTIDRNSFEAGARGDAQYNEELALQQKRLKEIDDMKKKRLDTIAMGNGQIMPDNKKGTERAIIQGYEQMVALTKDINAATRKIDSSISVITEDAKASLMNGLSKGVSNELAVNKNASHAQTVDSYASKKDQK